MNGWLRAATLIICIGTWLTMVPSPIHARQTPPAPASAQADRSLELVSPASGPLPGTVLYTNSHAIIIGINQYPNLKDNNLHFAVQDARDLREMLIKYYGFPSENITLLLDGDATKKQIEDALGDLADGTRVKVTDRVLVFFAGHGQTVKLAGGEVMGFLLPSDADADVAHPENRSGYLNACIDMKSVWTKLEACGARHRLLIADACFGGLLAHSRALHRSPSSEKPNNRMIKQLLETPAMQVIAGGSAGQTTREDGQWGHGAFTYKLLEKLRIHASTENDVFLASQLGDELKTAVGNLTDGAQSPQVENYGGTEGDFLFLTTKPQLANPYHAGLMPPQPGAKPNRTNAKDGAEMVCVPAGEFTMGDNDAHDNHPHRVMLSSYFIYKNPVTVAQYRKFCLETGREMPWKPSWGWKDDHPMVNVSWDDAQAYCKWAGVRLPTEAEWEKAARGPDGRKYPWGDFWDATKCVNSVGKTLTGTRAVGRYMDSPYGISDLVGNVCQYCADWYDVDYCKSDHGANPPGPASGQMRVVRGGYWKNNFADNFRASHRFAAGGSSGGDYVGFRCVAAP